MRPNEPVDTRVLSEETPSPLNFAFQFADCRARFSGSGKRIVPHFFDAFRHLAVEPLTEAELKIHVLGSSKKDRPPIFSITNEDWSFVFQDGTLSGTRDGRFVRYSRDWSEQILDRRDGRLLAWYDDDVKLAISERSKPLSVPLSVWYNDRGIQIVHAALLSLHGAGILIAGPAGCGKTTVALACAREGFRFLGDDYSGLGTELDGSFPAYSLYNSARLDRRALDCFPQLKDHVEKDDQGNQKSVLFVSCLWPDSVDRLTQIRLILLPRLSEAAETRALPMEKGKALLRFAYSSLQIPAASPASRMAQLRRLLDRVPAYWLELGTDILQIPACVAKIVKEVTLSD